MTLWNTSRIIPYSKPSRVEDLHIYGINPASLKNTQRQNVYAPDKDMFIPSDNVNLAAEESPERLGAMEMRVFKFASMIYLTVIQREHDREHTANFLDTLKSYMNANVEASVWFLL